MRSIVIPVLASLAVPALEEPSDLYLYGLDARSTHSLLTLGVDALLHRRWAELVVLMCVDRTSSLTRMPSLKYEFPKPNYIYDHPKSNGYRSEGEKAETKPQKFATGNRPHESSQKSTGNQLSRRVVGSSSELALGDTAKTGAASFFSKERPLTKEEEFRKQKEYFSSKMNGVSGNQRDHAGGPPIHGGGSPKPQKPLKEQLEQALKDQKERQQASKKPSA